MKCLHDGKHGKIVHVDHIRVLPASSRDGDALFAFIARVADEERQNFAVVAKIDDTAMSGFVNVQAKQYDIGDESWATLIPNFDDATISN